MIRAVAPILALTALAACQPAQEPVTANETAPANDSADQAFAAAIPDAMHGRWGLVPADCTTGRGDEKGLLTITADTLTFYESRARLTAARDAGADRVTGDFAFTGEGQEWTRTITFTLGENGAALLRADADAPADGGPQRLTYRKCPA